MDVEGLLRDRPQRIDDQGANGDVGHKAAVHDINVHPVAARLINGLDLQVVTSAHKRGSLQVVIPVLTHKRFPFSHLSSCRHMPVLLSLVPCQHNARDSFHGNRIKVCGTNVRKLKVRGTCSRARIW